MHECLQTGNNFDYDAACLICEKSYPLDIYKQCFFYLLILLKLCPKRHNKNNLNIEQRLLLMHLQCLTETFEQLKHCYKK